MGASQCQVGAYVRVARLEPLGTAIIKDSAANMIAFVTGVAEIIVDHGIMNAGLNQFLIDQNCLIVFFLFVEAVGLQ